MKIVSFFCGAIALVRYTQSGNEHKKVDGALLRGPLLIEAQKWFDQRSQDLSDQERKFISASRALRERLAREGMERQERELEAAQKLARTEATRANDQARAAARSSWLIATMVVVFGAGV